MCLNFSVLKNLKKKNIHLTANKLFILFSFSSFIWLLCLFLGFIRKLESWIGRYVVRFFGLYLVEYIIFDFLEAERSNGWIC